MGSLSNLYISQSYQSLIHLGTNNTASANLIELEDGLGNGIGISVNTAGDLKVNGILSASIITDLSQSINSLNGLTGSYATTGSNIFNGNQTVNGDVQVNGTLSATEIHTLIESSSIIYSSGSNILGDELTDVQTLIGSVIISGSQSVSGSAQFTGTISSPTITIINGRLANLENFTASSDSRLNNLESKSASVDISISNLNSFSSTQLTKDSTLAIVTGSLNAFTQSANGRLTNLESTSASVNISISNLNTFTSSANSRLNAIESVSGSWITESETSSFARTGTNTFSGSQTITGSVYGNVISLNIVSSTASMDFSLGNFYTLTLVSGSTTRIEASNVRAGQTINLLVSQPSVGFGNVAFDSKFKQTFGFGYTTTQSGSANDILTFVTFNTASIWTANIKNLV